VEFGITDELLTKLGQERYGDPRTFLETYALHPNTLKAELDFEYLLDLADLTGTCKFATQYNLPVAGLSSQDLSELLTSATGQPFSVEKVVQATRRVRALERAFNGREGMRRIDDYPFVLWWELKHGKPHPVFGGQELPVNLESYDAILDEWYRLRGYDLETGIPTTAELQELGLADVAADLETRQITP
jgi:aldehyde:ferredoxin oxidoreductase